MTDIIADTLTRVRNATRVGHKFVGVRCTKKTRSVIFFLWREGYVSSYETIEIPSRREDLLLVKLVYVRPSKGRGIENKRERLFIRRYARMSTHSRNEPNSEVSNNRLRETRTRRPYPPNAHARLRSLRDSIAKYNVYGDPAKSLLGRRAGGKKVPLLRDLKRVSKPGRRVYLPCRYLPRYLSGSGTLAVSTSQGLLTDREAYSKGLGGEIWFSVKLSLPLSKADRVGLIKRDNHLALGWRDSELSDSQSLPGVKR